MNLPSSLRTSKTSGLPESGFVHPRDRSANMTSFLNGLHSVIHFIWRGTSHYLNQWGGYYHPPDKVVEQINFPLHNEDFL